MDEPFTGLDPAGGERVAAVLTRFRAEGRIVAVVTHDVPRGLALSDRTVVLQAGRKALDMASSDCSVDRVNEFFGTHVPEAA